ncbi:hypothetical protein [Streptomyces sp. MS1.AVA.4]|uniref:Uncharacterized protein n=1 Tax=Streptomyces pratisoli TaxID=3139917 RepID=A0ACC6Q9Y8_9ACTN
MVQYLRDLWAHIVVEDNVDDVEQVVFDGPDAVVLGSFFRRVRSTGRTFTMPVAMHLRVGGDKLVRMHLFEHTLLAQQAFKGGPDRHTATWTRGLGTALRRPAESGPRAMPSDSAPLGVEQGRVPGPRTLDQA